MSNLRFNLFMLFITLFPLEDACIISVRHTGYHVRFGHQIAKWNLSDCNETCLADPSCIGFDWDHANPGCFLFGNLDENATMMYGVDHYYIYRNNSLCQGNNQFESWEPMINKSLSGGASQTSFAENLGECVVLCLTNVYCKGLNWNQMENKCQIITNAINGHPVDDDNSYYYKRLYIPDEPPPTTTSPATPTTKSSLFVSLSQPTTTTIHQESTTTPTTTTVYVTVSLLPATYKTTNTPMIQSFPLTTKSTENQSTNQPSTQKQTKVLLAAATIYETDSNVMAIRPVYVVLVGLGLGCIALTITAVVILCMYPLNKKQIAKSAPALNNADKHRGNDQTKLIESTDSKKGFNTVNSVGLDFENPAYQDMEVVETEHRLDEVYAK
ncbi:hypothetical protein HELRODRAFT_193017 [Helobdella robusta]|uniref:Apple domain-containing protein n=1 Tax=Helobdella robusta TaxID=6412 RepID=T1FUI8_HELRO|nr:hypothetical protein HELRODRAFT_193017 [Helobdella robusta]ESN98252.1 hypothetical protein HELRODRAFT_193017 [Helobdella robusta]